ncbi:hypothetical protein [Phytobacter sp. RSE-02]|uniref:hypothetical protein n=1 Tax=Phytobacter sp. RSE-02 TaxID=3229229 RepID=UPI00339D3F3D
MDIKKYEVPFTILIAVVAFLEILFLIKVLFADAAGFEWGSVTDWVSAICNIAMASAAAYAALQAKKWFENKKVELGYLSARDLFLTLMKMRPVLDNMHTHVEHFCASSDVSEDLAKIEKILSEFYTLIADYEKSIFELNGVGWNFKKEYTDIYNLPLRVDIEPNILQARVTEIFYLDAIKNSDLHSDKNSDVYDPDYVKNQARQLEHDIKELLTTVIHYNEVIDSILNERLQYELYFDIKTK